MLLRKLLKNNKNPSLVIIIEKFNNKKNNINN